MKFSVLMSLYHAEKPEFLRECLNSLQAQTRLADEMVVVFDGEIPPELVAVVSDFQAALNIKIVRLPENVGLGKALNFGINHCSHEHIFRMDSDDIALPQRFEQQCAFGNSTPKWLLVRKSRNLMCCLNSRTPRAWCRKITRKLLNLRKTQSV